MLGEDDPTAPTPKVAPAPTPGSAQHALEHCRVLRDNLGAIGTALASLREEIDRSLRETAAFEPREEQAPEGKPT